MLAEEVRLRHTPNPNGTTQTETLKSVTWDYEPGTWRPLSQTETLHHANGETQRNTYAILSDHLGTPKELLDPEGEIAWAADSDLWGDTTVLAEAKTDCPLRFQGQYFDEESRLAYNCQRYYDPATGRYLSNDPLGLAGGPSPHAYVPNPLTWVDPLGLATIYANPNEINFSQRTVGKGSGQYANDMQAGNWDWKRSGPLRVMEVDGQLVSYDNRRLLAAQNVGLEQVPIEIVRPGDTMPGSKKTWGKAFDQRLNDSRNVEAGGALPPEGTSNQPTVVCKK